MRINLIRKIDYYFGPIICRFLLFCRYLKSHLSFNKASSDRSYKNVLVIKFFGMGTILLASPALRELRNKYKHSEITILTIPENRELCQILSFNTICLDIKTPMRFLVSFCRLLGVIRKINFDVVIDLEFLTNFSALIVILTVLLGNPKISVGFNSPIRWRNAVHKLNVSFDHSRHITKIFEKVVRSLEVDDFEFSFQPERLSLFKAMNAEYMGSLRKFHNALSLCNYIICININAGELSLHRRWPIEYFAAVVNELVKNPDIGILLLGSKKEAEYVSKLKSLLVESLGIIDLSGKTGSIRDLIGLLKCSNLLITNDSGPFHLAHIIGLPTISFFGPETPYLYGPVEGNHYIFYEDLYCSPCLNIYNSKTSYCRKNVCLSSIKPQAVIEIIKSKYLLPEGALKRNNYTRNHFNESGNIKR